VTASSIVGAVLTLGLVLTLVALTMRLLRRVANAGTTTRQAGMRLEVVQRVALGPRQGIAVVQVGDQLLAVSVGEGGVRTLAELDQSEAVGTATSKAAVEEPRRDFARLLRQGLRSAGVPLAILLATTVPPFVTAAAQGGRAPSTPAPAASSGTAQAAPAPDALDAMTKALPQLDLRLNEQGGAGGLRLSGTVGVVVLMGALTLLPTLMLLMTSFTRIIIVFHFLKQALGTQTTPPAHLLSALALLLTGFVMTPTLSEMNTTAITPWMDGKIDQVAMMRAAVVPFRTFMLRQVEERDLQAFVEMSHSAPPARAEDVSTVVLMSAFVTSELRTAFQLGFVLFLPFIIIDIVVSSVLMSMGMFMLPPAMISLPFKLLLFVLVDGWTLLVQSLVAGFR
jgi:flagellar biosynthetic protein FliP